MDLGCGCGCCTASLVTLFELNDCNCAVRGYNRLAPATTMSNSLLSLTNTTPLQKQTSIQTNLIIRSNIVARLAHNSATNEAILMFLVSNSSWDNQNSNDALDGKNDWHDAILQGNWIDIYKVNKMYGWYFDGIPWAARWHLNPTNKRKKTKERIWSNCSWCWLYLFLPIVLSF